MSINLNEISFIDNVVLSKSNRAVLQENQTISTPSQNPGKAGQRRLRIETNPLANRMILNAVADRPADDLQAVYEKFNQRLNDTPHNLNSLKAYFAGIGDIEAMKVLIKYGANVALPDYVNGTTPIHYAVMYSRYEMIMFLAVNGAMLPPIAWARYMNEIIPNGKTTILKDISKEKLMVLEYLLDHGTGVNDRVNDGSNNGGLLAYALNLWPKNLAEEEYKNSVIKMLLDRGAKLNN